MSLARQNYHAESEAGVNKQINQELSAMYAYTALAAFYDRDDVAFENVAAFFRKSADEEKSHADLFIEYQNKRGGRVTFEAIEAPAKVQFASLQEAFETALALEKKVNQCLLDLHALADKNHDSQMTDFLEGKFLGEQVDALKELSGHITNLKRLGTGLGEWHFNKSL